MKQPRFGPKKNTDFFPHKNKLKCAIKVNGKYKMSCEIELF